MRKARFSLADNGKSGGIRVLYVDFAFYEKLFMLNVYPKSKKESLTDGEKAKFKKAVKALEDCLKRS